MNFCWWDYKMETTLFLLYQRFPLDQCRTCSVMCIDHSKTLSACIDNGEHWLRPSLTQLKGPLGFYCHVSADRETLSDCLHRSWHWLGRPLTQLNGYFDILKFSWLYQITLYCPLWGKVAALALQVLRRVLPHKIRYVRMKCSLLICRKRKSVITGANKIIKWMERTIDGATANECVAV